MSGSNIFNNTDKKDNKEFLEKVDVHSKAILTVTQRQKDLESSVDLLNDKFEMLDHNSVANFKKVSVDIKNLRDDLHDIKEDIKAIKEFNAKVAKQMRLMAGADEVAKLEKYIDLWDPMSFVTREELENSQKKTVDVLRQIIEEFLNGSEKKK